MMKKESPDLKYYSLVSVNIFRKYIGVFDMIFTLLNSIVYANLNPFRAWKAMSIHYS